ncbi:hypothetical protein E3N88_45890 [Mikania micrantha]|uniref:Uncharacterized protein n=1 Tax=Mikania micrantha TaxID=192012 RepID=A0A5N6L8H0_9ASTR|nr:hypothetical protein E3N88_45890 [Mikania micrantha]
MAATSLLSLSLPKPTILTPKSTASIVTPSVTVTDESLDQKFGRKGIRFTETDDGAPVAELTVRNGSSLKLQLNNAHVSSYKPKVYWKDDGFEESKGVDLSEWVVKDADSDSIDAVQPRYLAISSPRIEEEPQLMASKGAHIALTLLYLLRLRFCPPSEAVKFEDPSWFSFGWEPEKKGGIWSLQDVPITILKHKLSRVYGTPLEDRLKEFYILFHQSMRLLIRTRIVFRVIRIGFEEIYLSSPGSLSEKYGKGYFICTGPAFIIAPITIEPGEEWRGAQVIEHDNL